MWRKTRNWATSYHIYIIAIIYTDTHTHTHTPSHLVSTVFCIIVSYFLPRASRCSLSTATVCFRLFANNSRVLKVIIKPSAKRFWKHMQHVCQLWKCVYTLWCCPGLVGAAWGPFLSWIPCLQRLWQSLQSPSLSPQSLSRVLQRDVTQHHIVGGK